MSETNTETTLVDSLEQARNAGNTWQFRGEEKELWVLNGQSGAGIGIKDPESDSLLGIITALFAFENSEPFLDYLDFGIKETTKQSGEIVPSMDNFVTRDCRLFRALLQSGTLQEVNEVGEHLEVQELGRKEMLDTLEQEYQSSLIQQWLNSFRISRYFAEGEGRLRNILKADVLKFKIEVGDADNPRHVAIVTFAKPSADARRDFEDNASSRIRETENNDTVTHIIINNDKKMKFAKKHFQNVEGVSIGEVGKPFNSANEEHVKAFRKFFIPVLWVRLADAIMNAFANTGKL